MSDVPQPRREGRGVEMKVRFAELPEGLTGMVGRYGLPSVEIDPDVSVFVWTIAYEDAATGSRDRSGDGLIVARVEDEDELAGCAAGIEDLKGSLSVVGLMPDAIVASCGPSPRHNRADLRWAMDLAMGGRLAWMAVSGFELSSPEIDVVAGVFDWEPGELPPEASGTERVIVLGDGEVLAADARSIREGGPPDWEPLAAGPPPAP